MAKKREKRKDTNTKRKTTKTKRKTKKAFGGYSISFKNRDETVSYTHLTLPTILLV